MSNMNQITVLKMQPHLKFVDYKSRANTVIKQGNSSDFIIMVKHGEFEIVKENLADVEAEVLTFLEEIKNQSNLEKQIAMLGQETYAKTKQFVNSIKG